MAAISLRWPNPTISSLASRPKDSTGQASQVFGLASMAHASVALWSDGTCTLSLQRGDTTAMREHILGALAARDQTMARGVSGPAPRDGTRTAYCNSDPRPLLLAIIEPASKKSKRPAIVANLYRAKGGASDICNR